LDLALFVNRQHDRMGRRIDIEPDNVSELAGKAWIARALGRCAADAVAICEPAR
jgi:hypothetical protein